MNIELRDVTENDGMDVYEMLQDLPLDENGFQNGGHGKSFEEYRAWLKKKVDFCLGVGLEDWQVPENTYWLYVDGVPVGYGKLRHRLTVALREVGGHIGYGIRPSQRGKGYGTLILKMLLEKARDLNIATVWIDCRADNKLSRKVIESNGGNLTKQTPDRLYYQIGKRQQEPFR